MIESGKLPLGVVSSATVRPGSATDGSTYRSMELPGLTVFIDTPFLFLTYSKIFNYSFILFMFIR